MCIDKNIRESILKEEHPYICIDASAGTGKTTIMVQKMFNKLIRRKLKHYQKVVLITFTNFATQQIRDKVQEISEWDEYREIYKSGLSNNIQIQTNNSFVLSEIIRPFLRDAYGKSFPDEKEIKQDFTKSKKFSTFEKGLKQLNKTGYLGSFWDNKKDFTFELALKILRKSKNAQKYIETKFPIFFLDEYQDTDPTMHDFFMFIKKRFKISLFIVGDLKQAIYGFRGADKEIFKHLLRNKDFAHYKLYENFRSHPSIQSYVNLLTNGSEPEEKRILSNNVFLIEQEEYFRGIIMKSIKSDNIAVLTRTWRQARDKSKKLKKFDFTLIEEPPLNSDYPNFGILQPFLKLYHNQKIGNNYSEYNVATDLILSTNKKNINEIIKINNYINKNDPKAILKIAKLTESNINNEESNLFFKSLNKKYQNYFSIKQPKRQIMTIHGSKGLEFDIVYIDADSFYYYEKFNRENHYVAITRAKNKLVIELNNKNYEEKLKELNAFKYFKHLDGMSTLNWTIF